MSEAERIHTEYLTKPSYTFLQSIHEGTAGICKMFHHDVFGCVVVSKTISLFGLPGGVAKSEPRLLKDLDHDRLVSVLEAQWDPDADPSLQLVTFTTDYCEGRSVHTALEEGHRFSINEALVIVADVLDALAYLHDDNRLVHRDIKPGNVLLDGPRRRGFVGDLGSAAELENGRVPAGAGTPLYIAPEASSGVVDNHVDLYGAGMVLLEMFNGPFPYDELDHDKIDARLAKGQRALPDRMFRPAPWVPPKAASLVRALCARNPNARPSTASAALRRAGDAAGVDWRRVRGAGLAGEWQGRWPTNQPVARARTHRVVAEPIETGRNRGKVLLTAGWRTAAGAWRGYARLRTRVDAEDPDALARFFRAVEAEAHAAPTR